MRATFVIGSITWCS